MTKRADNETAQRWWDALSPADRIFWLKRSNGEGMADAWAAFQAFRAAHRPAEVAHG